MTFDFENMVQACRWNALHNAAKTMRESGGGFAGSMAEAWQKADKTNKTRIEEAFPDLFFRFMGESDRSYFGDKIHWKRLNTMSNFKETLLNVLTCIGLGLALCAGLMAYFDILVKWNSNG